MEVKQILQKEKINILYVDDEPNNLISFTANFREFYNVFTAASAIEGKNILNSQEINVLITDQRMPDITGVQFLEEILNDHPFPVRIILTGYADIETVIEAINKGQVYRYIMKPFDPEEIKLVIENAYDLYVFRKNSKEALCKFQHLFEKSNDSIFIVNEDGKFKELNSFGLNLFKIKKSAISNTSLSSLFISQEEYSRIYANLLKNEAVIDLPVKLKNSNNIVIDALLSAAKIREEGKVIGFQGMIRDITRQKEIESIVIRTIIETQENERMRFGKNLHDGVGSMLAAIKIMLHALTIKNEQLKNDPALDKIFEALNSTIVEMRNVCFNIMPKSLEVMGLACSIDDLCRQHEDSDALNFEFNIPDDFPKLNIQLELAIFRVVQEFINNSITHGKAKKIKLDFSCEANNVVIKLKDNGIGFNVNSYPVGLGLKNIKSRVQSYKGEIKIISALTMGTEYIIVLPLVKSSDISILN